MALKSYNPTTPSQRQLVIVDRSGLWKGKPVKALTEGLSKSGGRNNYGRITARFIGGGHKRRYRVIDFARQKFDVPATVLTVEYDPNRTSRIALIEYTDGVKTYILAPAGIQVGQTVISGESVAPEVGNTLPLANIPLGTLVHAIELQPGKGAEMVRSAGTYAQLLARDGKYATLKLPSGEMRMVLARCLATIGTVSNSDHMNVNLGKAGRHRWLGRRPRVRGVVMNPVDHPMGGGEGRSSGGHPRSRTGLLAKGKKTRNPKKHTNRLIISRRKK
jgi:large subunit ribosomal protein L2